MRISQIEMQDKIYNNRKFEAGLEKLGIMLDQNQICQFEQYYDILIEWNKKMNLTAITDYDEVITKHFLDSLSLVKALEGWRKLYSDNEEKDISQSLGERFDGSNLDSLHCLSAEQNGKERPDPELILSSSEQNLDSDGRKFEEAIPAPLLKEGITFIGSKQENEKKSTEADTSQRNILRRTVNECVIENTNEKSDNEKVDFKEKKKFSRASFKGLKMLDIGTGAGFPGIPLKIAFPDLDILLVDSLNKRINFLNEVITVLKLENISAIHGRAEELGRKKEYRQQYDLCVSRAVAKLYLLSEYCLPFIRCGGRFISYKSGKVFDEVKEARFAIKKLGGNYMETVTFTLPDTDIERGLVVIEKVAQTPADYPRNAGKISKSPLLGNKTI